MTPSKRTRYFFALPAFFGSCSSASSASSLSFCCLMRLARIRRDSSKLTSYMATIAANSNSMVTGDASGVTMAEMTMSATYTVRQLPRSFLYGMTSKMTR